MLFLRTSPDYLCSLLCFFFSVSGDGGMSDYNLYLYIDMNTILKSHTSTVT